MYARYPPSALGTARLSGFLRLPPAHAVLAALSVSLAAAPCACSRKQAPSSGGGPPGLLAPAADQICTYPHTTRDQRGVDVTLAAPAHRILSLLPSHTETLFALGLGPDVVGVDDFSADIPGAGPLPRLGGLYDTHAEALLALRPDLALVSETSPAAGALEHAGVPTWGGSAASFDAIPVVISALGSLVCRSQEAARVVRQLSEDTAAVETAAAGRPRVRVYYEARCFPLHGGPAVVRRHHDREGRRRGHRPG